jgi:hypothetical protein
MLEFSKPERPTDAQLKQFEDMLKPYESAYMNYMKSGGRPAGHTPLHTFSAQRRRKENKKWNTIIERFEF